MKKSLIKMVLVVSLSITIVLLKAQTKPQLFQPNDSSLKQYKYPEWFRDAKFGIWSHWGPQAVPRQGDWYARRMYEGLNHPKILKPSTIVAKADTDYLYHIKNYGHPSTFGYKDIIPLWKAERWNPDALMKLYKKIGAKYFVSMGVHHDNFFLWNSKIHRWNSVQMGPKKDVVALWQQAAKKQGLRFGVSEHLAASYTWFQAAHGADKTGDKAGIPYDGNDPLYQDLYHRKAAPNDTGWTTKDKVWQKEWLASITELIDMYSPDLLYSDCGLPFGNEIGRSMIAHYYNQDMAKNNGQLQAVYNCKEASNGRYVRDVERGVLDSISEYPWQTDTSIGDWFYATGQKYHSADEIIQMLVDIVSKNGNLLLNVVQTPEGDLEPDVLQILDGIGTWTNDNSEAIYGTRPWKIYGEGPSTTIKQVSGNHGGIKDVRSYVAEDIRFTTKNGVLYAFCMNTPKENINIKSLAEGASFETKKVAAVTMLGTKQKTTWSQNGAALSITKPTKLPNYKVIVFKIVFK